MSRLRKRPTDCLSILALLAAVVVAFPLAPAGFGLLAANEVDAEQMPGESEELPDGTALSPSENRVEHRQRRIRCGTAAQNADASAVQRLADHVLQSTCEHECFSLPLRC